jgi:P-type conjugative transfer protein TrbL
MDPNAIGGQFTAAAQAYANGIQPYATRLLAALLFIEILVTAIQYMTDQGDASRYIGRLFRHLFSAGFIYLMLVNAFPWMTGVMKSFSAIGAAVSGVPNLSPSTVLDLGGQMAETIYNTPASTGMIPNFALALDQTVAAFFILLSFTIIAALALLVVIEMYLVVGGASILLAFGGSRFTAPIAEGYFGYVIKAGVRLLFFYLVLEIGVKIATQWNNALVAACVPTTTTLPWYFTYGVPPSSIVTKVCSAPMNWPLLLNLVANSVILAIVTTVVPSTAAGIVSGTAGLALNQAFEAAFIARTIIQPISSMMQSVGNKAVRALGGSDGSVEARFRANEAIQPLRASADPPEARVGAAPNSGMTTDPNAGTRVLDSKLTQQIGAKGATSGGSTSYIGGNGNGKPTSGLPSGSGATAKA